jgi:ABC-2 type transport system permease protein
MMSALQNAFANSSSSLIQSKVTGSVVFVLLPPISYVEFFLAYVAAAILRGLMVGTGVLLLTIWFRRACAGGAAVDSGVHRPGWGDHGCAGNGRRHLGRQVRPTGGFSELPDHAADHAFRRFYSIHSLPEFWQQVSRFNPVFYMIDGFRFGFFGVSDVPPEVSLAVVATSFLLVSAATLALLRSGYKLRS